MSTTVNWTTDSEGGYMYNDELSDTLRTALQPLTKFR
jgi:alkylated DNA repair dioxygenase AlkB